MVLAHGLVPFHHEPKSHSGGERALGEDKTLIDEQGVVHAPAGICCVYLDEFEL